MASHSSAVGAYPAAANIVGRFVGRKSVDFDFDEEEEETARRAAQDAHPTNKWGRHGISVSADEDVRDAPRKKSPANGNLDPEAQPLVQNHLLHQKGCFTLDPTMLSQTYFTSCFNLFVVSMGSTECDGVLSSTSRRSSFGAVHPYTLQTLSHVARKQKIVRRDVSPKRLYKVLSFKL